MPHRQRQLGLLTAALLAGCAPGTSPDSAGPHATDSGGSTETGDSGGDSAGESGAAVANGPMVGGVTATRATVWARLGGSGQARVVYGLSDDLADGVATPWLTAEEAHDWTLEWPLTGLSEDTRYVYRVEAGGEATGGSFSTFPAPAEVRDFRFVVFSDIASAAPAPAYHAAYGKDPAFVLQIGDFDHNDPAAVAVELESWRAMHRWSLTEGPHGQDLSEWILPNLPVFHMWDDHDYGANNAGGDAEFRDIATQAFLEYYPVGERPNPSAGLWYSFRYAQVEVFMLDLRSQRDGYDDAAIPVKSVLAREPMPDDQLSWLKQGLADSTATWKVVVSTSVWNPHSKTMDSWVNYPEEQAAIVSWIADQGIAGVLVVSGDIHSGGAIDDGANSWFPELSVPTTNLNANTCTGICGTWSVGLVNEPGNRSGFGMFDFRFDPASGRHTATLSAHDGRGDELLQYVLTAD